MRKSRARENERVGHAARLDESTSYPVLLVFLFALIRVSLEGVRISFVIIISGVGTLPREVLSTVPHPTLQLSWKCWLISRWAISYLPALLSSMTQASSPRKQNLGWKSSRILYDRHATPYLAVGLHTTSRGTVPAAFFRSSIVCPSCTSFSTTFGTSGNWNFPSPVSAPGAVVGGSLCSEEDILEPRWKRIKVCILLLIDPMTILPTVGPNQCRLTQIHARRLWDIIPG